MRLNKQFLKLKANRGVAPPWGPRRAQVSKSEPCVRQYSRLGYLRLSTAGNFMAVTGPRSD